MRMRARCAAWQLWVSEKFSLLSVVNTRPVYTYNTPKTQFGADITNTADSLELIPPFLLVSISLKKYECVSMERRDRSVFHYITASPLVKLAHVSPLPTPNCTTGKKTAPIYVHLLRTRAIIRHAHAGANCRIKYSGLHKIHPKWHFKPPLKNEPEHVARRRIRTELALKYTLQSCWLVRLRSVKNQHMKSEQHDDTWWV